MSGKGPDCTQKDSGAVSRPSTRPVLSRVRKVDGPDGRVFRLVWRSRGRTGPSVEKEVPSRVRRSVLE